jgi:chemotaxis protein MotB
LAATRFDYRWNKGKKMLSHLSRLAISTFEPRHGNKTGIREMRELAFVRAAVTISVLLLLAGCVSQQKYNALDQEYGQLQQQMAAETGAQQMQITRLQNSIRLSINSQLLFPSGGWQMSDQAQQSIAKVAAILAPHQTTTINVNGYTDNTPIGPELARQGVTSNLILSQKRADNVAQFMISQGVKPNLVTTQGFGDADPVASNDTAAGRAQNRRVELTLADTGTQN